MKPEQVNLSGWQITSTPADLASIARLAAWAPVPLPPLYLELLELSDGGEGPLAIQPWWFQLWPTVEIAEHHKGYETAKYFPEYVGFGSSGGGVMLAFRKGAGGAVFGIDFCNANPNDIKIITEDFETFTAVMGIEAKPGAQADGPASGGSAA